MSDQTTHFGYKTVNADEKSTLVKSVFDSVADKYDIMNDAMSFGLHRLWKKFTINLARLRPGDKVLDIAAGSGDLSIAFAKKVGPSGLVIASDINAAMLEQGRRKIVEAGVASNTLCVQANAEDLCFDDNTFNRVSISFGLRNVTDKQKALESMYRVIKPGGFVMILEFSKPVTEPLQKMYDAYSFNVIPQLGQWITNDRESYQYLVESIRKHPDQETLATMMRDAGFESVVYHNLNAGIVALHIGYKY